MTDEPQHPTSNDDRDGWKAYWTAQGMPWRTEPEIDEERMTSNHYQQTVAALAETRRIMDEIDEVIKDHTGWPLDASGDQ